MTQFARRRPLVLFFTLAYALAWVAFLPVILTNAGLKLIRVDVPIEFMMIGACAPTVAALWVQRLAEGNFRICRMRAPGGNLLLGLLAGWVAMLLGFVAIPALAMTSAPPESLNWSVLWTISAYGINYSTILGGPLFEEPGWRGFALPRLQSEFGPLRASLLLGILWALWHLPGFLIEGWARLPLWAYIVWLTCQSVLMTCAANLSRFSIVVAILMHALFNSIGPVLGGVLGNAPQRPHAWLFFITTGCVMPAILILITRGKLGATQAPPSEGT